MARIAFAESRTKLEKEKAEAEKERLELFNKYIKFNALGESYETCVKRFGNPLGPMIEIDYMSTQDNFFYEVQNKLFLKFRKFCLDLL